jgi:hypothetical protein
MKHRLHAVQKFLIAATGCVLLGEGHMRPIFHLISFEMTVKLCETVCMRGKTAAIGAPFHGISSNVASLLDLSCAFVSGVMSHHYEAKEIFAMAPL